MPVNLYMVLYENRLEFGQFMQFCGMIVHLITSYCLLSGIFIESNYILNCQIELIWVVGVDFDTINLTSNSGIQVPVHMIVVQILGMFSTKIVGVAFVV